MIDICRSWNFRTFNGGAEDLCRSTPAFAFIKKWRRLKRTIESSVLNPTLGTTKAGNKSPASHRNTTTCSLSSRIHDIITTVVLNTQNAWSRVRNPRTDINHAISRVISLLQIEEKCRRISCNEPNVCCFTSVLVILCRASLTTAKLPRPIVRSIS